MTTALNFAQEFPRQCKTWSKQQRVRDHFRTSVRVVARVTRDMRFVDGKPLVTAVQGSWRITMKAYQLKIAPLEGHPEMITAQSNPEFAFPPGRYALVLNGTGYDFTVQGTITSPEQCLEQAEMLNGTVLSECARS